MVESQVKINILVLSLRILSKKKKLIFKDVLILLRILILFLEIFLVSYYFIVIKKIKHLVKKT